MESFLEIKDLTLKLGDKVFFENFNLTIEKNSFVSIIGPNGSGKSLLTKVLSAILPTTDMVTLDGIKLNKDNVLKYLTKIGVVTNDFNQEFLFKKVKDELAYPLLNLGYPEHKINKQIASIAEFYQIGDLLNKNIDDLTISLKKKLLIILALIHEPTLLILDDAFYEMDSNEQKFMLEKLSILKEKGLTILNITSKLDTVYNSNKIYILNRLQIEGSGKKEEILEDINKLLDLGFQIPFFLDISNKLKYYKILDKTYFDLNELEGALWK